MIQRFTVGKSIGACIAELVIGIMMLVNPSGFSSVICVLIGIAMLGFGAWSLLQYFRAPAEAAIKGMEMSRGLIMILLGLFCTINHTFLTRIFGELTTLYSIIMLVLGVIKVQWVVDQLRLKVARWYIPAVDAGLTIVLGVIMLLNPFSTVEILATFIGVSMIVSAVIDIASTVVVRKYL